MQLSRSFEPFKKEILQSQTFALYIEATASKNIAIVANKFGGFPYLPTDQQVPTDQDNKPMQLLAQLNFSELPKLAGYPQQGILQFFIGGNSTYGCNFEEPTQQKNFKICYYSNPDFNAYQTEFGQYNPFQNLDNSPLDGQEYLLSFSANQEYVPSSNVEFKKFLGDTVECFFENNFGDNMYDTWDEYDKVISSKRGHKIAGYANFTQNDPRQGKFEDYILLLQIDSQQGISWGDAGIGNFFIHPEDLANLDFTKVLYNWDCH